MGCGSSRIGGTAVFPPRLPSRRPHESDEDESCSPSQKYGTPLSEEKNIVFGGKCEEKHGNPKLELEAGFQKNQTGSRDEFEDALADTCEDVNMDEDEDEDERKIGQGAFPGSPSFRYFCKDDDVNDLGKNYKIKSTMPNDNDDDGDDTISKENYNDEKKQVKRVRRRSFKKVMPKGGQAAVKKLLSVKLRYNHSSSTRHHDHH